MDIKLIQMVIATLNCVEVRGKDNLDRLLGCINALENIVRAQLAAPTEEPGKEETDG